MKRKIIIPVFFLMFIILNACKKTSELQPVTPVDSVSTKTSLPAITPNTVLTVAGAGGSPGFVDGPVKTARFNSPKGLQLMSDGTLYIADTKNNAVRKITTDGNVSTLKLQTPPNGETLRPAYVGVDTTGKIHIVSANEDQDGLTFIYNANGTMAAEGGFTYTYLGPLAKDPYTNTFYFAEGIDIVKHSINNQGSVGTTSVNFNNGLLTADEIKRGQFLNGLFVGENRVIYFATTKHLFKYTPEGYTEQLYPTLKLGNITSIVLNNDSHTIYLAADGKIERIVDGKLTLLAGPNATISAGQDGVGKKADVNAFALALGDHENSIYFTDTKTNTIRKFVLK